MKTLLAALTLCFSVNAVAVEHYRLEDFSIDQDSMILPQRISQAMMTIDEDRSVVRLDVQEPWSCPAGMMCAMVMPATRTIELPIVHLGVPFCGGRIIVAETNELPVDGIRTYLEILDNNGSACNGADPVFYPIEITLTETLPFAKRAYVSTMAAVRTGR